MSSFSAQPTDTDRHGPTSRIPHEDSNPNAYQLYLRVLWAHPDQGEAIWGDINPPFPESFALFNIFPVEIQCRIFRACLEPRPRIIRIEAHANDPPAPDADLVIFDHHPVVEGATMNIFPMLQTNQQSRNEVLRLYTDQQVLINRHQYPSIDVLRDIQPGELGADPNVPVWPPSHWRLINHLRALYFQEDVDMLYMKDEFAISAFFIDIATGHDHQDHPNRINEEGFLITLNSQVRRLALGCGISTVPVLPFSDFFRTGLDYVALFTGLDLIYVVLPELSDEDMIRYIADWENGFVEAREAISEREGGSIYHNAAPTILWITEQQMNDMRSPEIVPPQVSREPSGSGPVSENDSPDSSIFKFGNLVPSPPPANTTPSPPRRETLEPMPPPPRPSTGNGVLNSIIGSSSGSVTSQSFPNPEIPLPRPDSPRPQFPRLRYGGIDASPGSIFQPPTDGYTYSSSSRSPLSPSTIPGHPSYTPPMLPIPSEDYLSRPGSTEVESLRLIDPPQVPTPPPSHIPSYSLPPTQSANSSDLSAHENVRSVELPSVPSNPPQISSPPRETTSLIPISFPIPRSPLPSTAPTTQSPAKGQVQHEKHICDYYIPHLDRRCKSTIAKDSESRCHHHKNAENKVTCDYYAGVKKWSGKGRRCGRKVILSGTRCESHVDRGEFP